MLSEFKYKTYIMILMVITLFLLLVGTHYYIERNNRISNFAKVAEGLVSLTESHLLSHELDWDLSPKASKEYIDDLHHIYSMLEKSFDVSDLILFDNSGLITFWGQKDIKKRNDWDFKDIKSLDGKNIEIVVRKTSIFSRTSPKIEAYSPIVKNGVILGYCYLLFDASKKDLLYLVFFDFFFLLLIIILVILLFGLFYYIQKYESENKKTLKQKKFLTDIFNITNSGIIVLDKHKKIKFMNTELEKLLGIKKEAYVESQICKDILCCSIERIGQNKTHDCPFDLINSQDAITYDFQVLNNKNELIHLAASVSKLYNQETNDYEIVMVVLDETTKKQEQLKLESLQEFENILNNSFLDIRHLVSFISKKMKEITSCSEFLLFGGASIENIQIIGYEEVKGDVSIDLLVCKDLITDVYTKKELQETLIHSDSLNGKVNVVAIPFLVNKEMVGAALLIFGEKPNLEPRKKVLLTQISKDIAVLIRVYKLVLDKEIQKQLLEKLYKLNVKLQLGKNDTAITHSVLLDIKEIVNADLVAVWRQETEWECIVGQIDNNHFNDETNLMKGSLLSGEPSIIENYIKDNHEINLLKNEKLITAYIKPMISNGVVLGGILFGFRQHQEIDEEMKKVVRMIRMLLTIYLENKSLNNRIECDATIAERERISREIHDGVAQTMGFINIQMHRLKQMLHNHEVDKVLHEIEYINCAVDQSYTELRDSIDNLRNKNKSASFDDWLSSFIADFQKKNSITIKMINSIQSLQITEKQYTQLVRVFQEIFNNIKKHSNATVITISISKELDSTKLRINDNGVGFDTSYYEVSRFSGRGLHILKERIEEINGNLSISSKLNKGTTIEIILQGSKNSHSA